MNKIDLPDEEATRCLGEQLGKIVLPGDLLLLEGELGSGKTTLVQGLARGLGVQDRITSPTFALLHEFSGRFPLRHIDLYRLDTASLRELGLEEWLAVDAVIAIEWAERLGPSRPSEFLLLRLQHSSLGEQLPHAGDGRVALLTASGERPKLLLEELLTGYAKAESCNGATRNGEPAGQAPGS